VGKKMEEGAKMNERQEASKEGEKRREEEEKQEAKDGGGREEKGGEEEGKEKEGKEKEGKEKEGKEKEEQLKLSKNQLKKLRKKAEYEAKRAEFKEKMRERKRKRKEKVKQGDYASLFLPSLSLLYPPFLFPFKLLSQQGYFPLQKGKKLKNSLPFLWSLTSHLMSSCVLRFLKCLYFFLFSSFSLFPRWIASDSMLFPLPYEHQGNCQH